MPDVNLNAFSESFQRWPGFSAFIEVVKGSPSEVAWINSFYEDKGGQITLGGSTGYGGNVITVNETWVTGTATSSPLPNTQLAVVLGHELGHAVNDDGHANGNVKTNPTEAAQVGENNEGVALYAEYRVATELDATMHSGSSLQDTLNGLAGTYGIDSAEFRSAAVSAGATYTAGKQPDGTAPGYTYEQYYTDAWIVARCGGQAPANVDWRSMTPGSLTYEDFGNGVCRVTGGYIPLKTGGTVSFQGTVSKATGDAITIDISTDSNNDGIIDSIDEVNGDGRVFHDSDADGNWDTIDYFGSGDHANRLDVLNDDGSAVHYFNNDGDANWNTASYVDSSGHTYRLDEFNGSGSVARSFVDNNGDSEWDRVDYFDGGAFSYKSEILTDGRVSSEFIDIDHDGQWDRSDYFAEGLPYAIRSDFFEDGQLVQEYIDTNGDGSWERADFFNGGAYAASAEVYENGQVTQRFTNVNGDASWDQIDYYDSTSPFAIRTDLLSGGVVTEQMYNDNRDQYFDRIDYFNGGSFSYKSEEYANGQLTEMYTNSNGDQY